MEGNMMKIRKQKGKKGREGMACKEKEVCYQPKKLPSSKVQ